ASAPQNYIEVSAKADKQITPDIIYVGITIREKDYKVTKTNADAKERQSALDARERQMIKALQSINIDVEKNLTVNDMSSNLKEYFLKKDNIIATKSYTLKLKTADEVATVFDLLNSMGISDVNLTRTAISPELEKQVKDELLASAAKKAKENANILAEAVGSKAGKAIYIQNYYNFAQPVAANYALRSAKAYATADGSQQERLPSLEINKSALSINVTCRFEILP
ncbi:MAG: SIMPL domain-containing protein, partial [Bacteroidales bacterium]|nr:SIMPL domain-containing protein [Bacteroidales bacterium]